MMGASNRAARKYHDLGVGTNQASLRVIMSAPPMSAADHAAAARRRTEVRRAIENKREREAAEGRF